MLCRLGDDNRSSQRSFHDVSRRKLKERKAQNPSRRCIKGQDYALFRSAVLPTLDAAEPLALYGVEFVFRLDEIKPFRGEDWQKAARDFVETVRQDSAKLTASLAVSGFMKQATTLPFLKGTSGSVLESITASLRDVSGVRMIAA